MNVSLGAVCAVPPRPLPMTLNRRLGNYVATRFSLDHPPMYLPVANSFLEAECTAMSSIKPRVQGVLSSRPQPERTGCG